MIRIISDYPDKLTEDKPLGDNHGLFFWHLLHETGVNMRDMQISYLWRDYKSYMYEYSNFSLPSCSGDTIVLLGKSVTKAFGIDDPIDKIRGSVIKWRENWVVPTFHPRNLKSPYRMFSEEPVKKSYFCGKDLEKANRIYQGGWVVPEERFNINPDIEQWQEFVEMAIDEQLLLAADIEATGLNLEYAQLVVIGFAWNESDCIVYPFTDYGGEPYWPEHQQEEADGLLRKLLRHGRFMFQNGIGYDVPLLRHRGYDVPLENYEHDTMILHHALDPELPHNIGFINSIYGKMRYWKNSFLTRKEHIHYTDQEEMKIYNARDCINLWQIYVPMMSVLKSRDLVDIYDRGMAVARPVIEMQEVGMTFSSGKHKVWTKFLEQEMYDIMETMKDIRQLPEEFNLNSPMHKRWLFYREPIKKAEKARQELALYDVKVYNYQFQCTTCGRKRTQKFADGDPIPPRTKMVCSKCKGNQVFTRTDKERTSVSGKKKNSNKYRELQAVVKVASVEPFVKVRGYVPNKTDKGLSALDRPEMMRMLTFINRRLEEIDNLVRPQERHKKEKEELLILRDFNLAYQRYAKMEKLQSAFGKFPVWKDGQVRPSLLVTGTATGRFSCKNPNLQQIPSGALGSTVRDCFTAPEGYHLLSVDFSNLEVHIGARIIGDPILIKALEAGQNYHDINTRAFFGIEPDNPLWGSRRKVAKMLGFARLLYGGSDEGIYNKVLVADPDFEMSLVDFKQSIQNYMDAHPVYVQWVKDTQERAKTGRITINSSGRTRTLYGGKAEILRQALNTPIQGSAADEVASDIILLREALKDFDSCMVMQIHDEILFNIREGEAEEVYKIIHRIMNRTREINGIKFKIPVDAEIGKYWGSMKGVDLLTNKIEGSSKH